MMKNIGFIGLGKLGLDCAEVFAQHYNVYGYDIYPKRSNRVKIATLEETINSSEWIFIAVPTPHAEGYDGSIPSSHMEPKDFGHEAVIDAIENINQYAKSSKKVVLISTVLPGTTRRNFVPILNEKHQFLYNPYLIAMGSVKWDMVNPEMIMIGTEDGNWNGLAKELMELYQPMMQNNPRFEIGTWDECEAIKIFYNCYSDDTEALTSNGWKLIKDVNPNTDKIFSLNPETLVPEYVKVKKIVGREHKGEMIHFHSTKDNILVTPEHNMFSGKLTHTPKNGKKYSYKWSLRKAQDIIQEKSFAFCREAVWTDNSPEFIDLGFAKFPTKTYVKMMAWYLSEGCSHSGRMIISQCPEKNPEKHTEVIDIMEEIKIALGSKMKICSSGMNKSILNTDLTQYLSQFGKSADKFIPDEIKNLGRDDIRLFLDIYNKADGSSMPKVSWSTGVKTFNAQYKYYATISDKMASDIGELIIKVGNFPSYRKQISTLSGNICHLVYELVGKTSIYQQSFTNGLKFNKVEYDGNVVCAMLEKNHVFLTRREGKCTWQGNTFISAKIGLANMIQDFALRIGNINTDVVTNALSRSTMRIMGPKYMTAGMGDAGACHPRDNIALRWLAQEYNLGYDIFDTIMNAREIQAKHLAEYLSSISEVSFSYSTPIVIHGKAYKPEVPYCIGSYSTLIGHYLKELGRTVKYLDPLADDKTDVIDTMSEPSVVLWAHNRKVTYDYTGEESESQPYCEIPRGSIIVDPWRQLSKNLDRINVIHYGNTRISNV
jgi:UDP-glucose 6-dehydrogenase